MNQWQSIESAPKDGTAIAVYLPWIDRVCTANWNSRTKRWTVHFSNHQSGCVYTEPPLWTDLPPLPQTTLGDHGQVNGTD